MPTKYPSDECLSGIRTVATLVTQRSTWAITKSARSLHCHSIA
jgi:hypothetical protein